MLTLHSLVKHLQ